ncbi:glucose-1-phosphate thymidylyltransferase [Patescibacteria group bacterium]
MKAIITAGGKGTRMRPLTFSSNKHFIPLANKPLLFYAIEAVASCGIKEVGINYNPGQLEEIKRYLGSGRKWSLKFTYILQKQPKGLADIVACCREFIGQSKFVMHLGDNIFYGGIKPLVDYFNKSKLNGMLTMIHHPESLRLGVPFFDKKGQIKKLVEKPKKAPHDWAIPGLYFADRNIFKCFSGKNALKPSARGEYEIPTAFQWLIDQGYQVGIEEFKGVWRDPGKFDDWIETNQFLLDADIENGIKSKLGSKVKIEGRVKVGRKCRIINSVLRGPVKVGNGVTIKGSFIGPYSSIGDNCKVIDTKVENSILMPGVIIDNLREPLDSSLIGQESVIEGNHKPFDTSEMFIGNQCHIKL